MESIYCLLAHSRLRFLLQAKKLAYSVQVFNAHDWDCSVVSGGTCKPKCESVTSTKFCHDQLFRMYYIETKLFLSGTSHFHMMNDSVIYTNRDGIPHMLEMPDASIHFAGNVVCGRVGRALPYSSPIHVASLLAAVWIGLKLFSAAEQTLYSFKLAHSNCCKWVVTAKSSKPGRAMAKKSLQNDGFILIANWMYD